MTMKTEKSQNLPSTRWRPDDVVQSESEVLRAREIGGVSPSLMVGANQCLVRNQKEQFCLPLPILF